MAQNGNSILTVNGCIRQGTQIACEMDLSNQNKSDTLMQSSTQWTDTYLIDDRGDRHTRAIGFFLNIDGEKRVDMDVPYGQSTRYVFVFNDVPAKVSQVSLHSSSGGLNIENISVPDPNAASTATTSANPAPAAGAAPSSSAKSNPGASKTKPGKTTGAATP